MSGNKSDEADKAGYTIKVEKLRHDYLVCQRNGSRYANSNRQNQILLREPLIGGSRC